MRFFLFDVGATLFFLLGYATVLALRERQAVLVAPRPGPSSPEPAIPARERQSNRPDGRGVDQRCAQQPRREWPRLISPR